MPVHDAALLLLGHGSTLNADSSAPTYQHAEEIRRRGLFADVQVAFWKEEPNFRQALRQTDCPRVYVVPNFISSGYFTEQIIPRELGLTGPATRVEDREVFFCEPVGLHVSMTEALLKRAREVVAASPETIIAPEKSACLFICGHGTSLNDNSTKIIHEQAALIRARGRYADCQAVLMEQSPFVRDWRRLTGCPYVIVVPFFIADGLHSFEDIPVLLGLTPNVREKSFANPHRENDRRLWYATAIGTEAFLADVIIAQVEQFQKTYPRILDPKKCTLSKKLSVHEAFRLFLEETEPPWRMGELTIEPGFRIRHHLDRETTNLRALLSLADLRDLIRFDESGRFRPLRSAPNLRRGWTFFTRDLRSLKLALDYIYPAELANWTLARQQDLPGTPWRETVWRQSGRFRIVREVTPEILTELVAGHCQSGCLKQRRWSPAEEAVQAAVNEIPLLCPEACNFLVGRARARVKGDDDGE